MTIGRTAFLLATSASLGMSALGCEVGGSSGGGEPTVDGGDGDAGSDGGDGVVCTGNWYIANDVELRALAAKHCATITGNLIIEPPIVVDAGVGRNVLDGVTSLGGLEELTTVKGDVQIHYNDALESLSGLNNLATIGGSLAVLDNAALGRLHGLENVTTISGELRVFDNDALLTLGPLHAWPANAVTGPIAIHGNEQLPQCQAEAFDAKQTNPNATLCSGCTDNLGAGTCD